MLSKRAGTATVPSRNALRVLRQLALAGSTVGGICMIATITYEVHRRIGVAETILEHKRALHSSTPYYDATSAAKRLSRMMEAAEEGEFTGLESLKGDGWKRKHSHQCNPNESEERSNGLTNYPNQATVLPPSPSAAMRRPCDIPSRLQTKWPSNTTVPSGAKVESLSEDNPKISEPWEVGKQQLQYDETDTVVYFVEVVEKLRDLIDRDRVIEAAELFLHAHPPTLRGISSERREIALSIFYLNCKQGNVFIARSMFERIREVDHVSPRMWKVLVIALAKNGSVESASQLYLRFRNSITLPPFMIEIVLRCLLESQRLRRARWLIYGSIRYDRNCGLCGLYLSGLWKKTRDLDLLNGQFKKLLSFFPRFGKRPTERLFNPMLQAYVEFGRVADAEALANEMYTKYGIPVSCRSKGLLLYAKALASDWDGVERGLQEMHDLKLTEHRVDFLRIFDRIFLEYWIVHKGTAIRDFFFRCAERYSIVPDRVLYQHVLESFVEKGDTDLIAELVRFGDVHKWKIPFNEEEFVNVLRSRRLARERSPAGFWQMLQAARVKYGQSATSRHILGYDRRSIPFREVNLMPRSDMVLPWYERTMAEVTPWRGVDQFQPLDKQMAQYMHAGNLPDALDAFKTARSAGFQLKRVHVELALIATLLEQGLESARLLLSEVWEDVRHTMHLCPLFFQQVMECHATDESDVIKLAIFRFYNVCWETPLMHVKHHLMVSTSRRLIQKEQIDAALDLLITAYKSRWGRRDKFDGTCMKIFVRAFALTDNLHGVRWCILTGLSRGSALNKDFAVEMRRLMAHLKLNLEHQKQVQENGFRERILKYLDFLTNLLEKKCDGARELLSMRIDRSSKRAIWRGNQQLSTYDSFSCDLGRVRRLVECWDEESELDAIFNLSSPDVQADSERWQESNVLEDWEDFDDGHWT